jgi:hypothetical protein
MPKGTKPTPPQQANLKEFWSKPKPKKKVEEVPVASGSGLKTEDADDMKVDEPSHRDPKGARPPRPQPIIVEPCPAEVTSSPPYGMCYRAWSLIMTHS